jgi:hypothetical protein
MWFGTYAPSRFQMKAVAQDKIGLFAGVPLADRPQVAHHAQVDLGFTTRGSGTASPITYIFIWIFE